jgi:ubiquinone/menaquinone biosynthesis C-methylase UbiE
MAADADYVWGTGLTEQQRLLKQIELYIPEATWLLDRLELARGSNAIDLGCGPLGILDLLSKRVGARGAVVGIEWESRFVDMAKTLPRERGIENVSVSVGDAAATGLPDASFSFVHERLLLIVVPEPEKVIAEMARLAEPGGVVALEDVDVGSGCVSRRIRPGSACSPRLKRCMRAMARICGSVVVFRAFCVQPAS